jgi:voltage-gated potassium channel
MSASPTRNVKIGLGMLLIAFLVGTAGYMLLERWSLLDAAYMTVISVTTTGFSEVHRLSEVGRVFTLLLIVLGVGSIAYTGSYAIEFLLENQLFTRSKSMRKKVAKMANHFIVCGYGRMGKYVCEDLAEKEAPFVVVEREAAKLGALQALGYLYVEGDATDDDTLLGAGIDRARGIVTVLGSDADNVFTTLSAKALNPKVFVVARAVDEETEPKLLKAGANRVVKPYETAGTKMAELLLRPGVIEFIDVVARDTKVDLNIEEIHISRGAALVGTTLAESPIRQELNIMVVAINKSDGRFIYNPTFSTILEEGDRLIALGERASLLRLTKLASQA